jgi:hypothetical protein
LEELRTIKAALKDKPDEKESARSEELTLLECDRAIVESLSVLLDIHTVEDGTNPAVVELYRELLELHVRAAEITAELEKYGE